MRGTRLVALASVTAGIVAMAGTPAWSHHRDDHPADIAVSVVDSIDPLYPGDLVVYSISVTNAGPSVASGVRVFLGTTGEVQNVTISKGSCTSEQPRICAIGELRNHEEAIVRVDVVHGEPAKNAFLSARAVSDATEDVSENNFDEELTTVLGPDLAIADFRLSQGPISVGDTFTVSTTVTNLGPVASQPGRVTSVITHSVIQPPVGFARLQPFQVLYESSSGDVTSCEPVHDDVHLGTVSILGGWTTTWCLIPSVEPGGSVAVHMNFRALQPTVDYYLRAYSLTGAPGGDMDEWNQTSDSILFVIEGP